MKIEIIKRFLSLLDAQMMFIRIVEKQQCSQYRTFTDTLSSREMHIPIYGNLPAQYKLYNTLHFIDSPLLLITAFSGFGVYFIYIHAFFKSLSWSFAEAAFIDGAGHFAVFFRIMLPQLAGIIAVFFVNAFIGAWNDWMTNYLYLPSKPQVAYAIYLVQGEATRISDYQMFYSAVMIGLIVPLIIFGIFSKKILSTVYTGGLKG